jgi:hypothetical protein
MSAFGSIDRAQITVEHTRGSTFPGAAQATLQFANPALIGALAAILENDRLDI